MAIQFDPPAGTVLLCDYSTGFRRPEMVKLRPALVVSPRLRHRRGLCTVVPLSTTVPDRQQLYHHELVLPIVPPEPWDEPRVWAKADMLATVGFERLDLMRTGRDQYGKRKYLSIKVEPADLESVRRCILHALGVLT